MLLSATSTTVIGQAIPQTMDSLSPHICFVTIARSQHSKEKSYRLHGFPKNFKFTKERNTLSVANVHGRNKDMVAGYKMNTITEVKAPRH